MENKETETFKYTYSAKQQEEIKAIRNKYTNPVEDKMDQLRRLDRAVTSKASAVALILGIAGTLILGLGMSLLMTDLGNLVVWNRDLTAFVGIAVGVAGIVIAGCAYPIYTRIVKSQREKIAPEIIRISDELMK